MELGEIILWRPRMKRGGGGEWGRDGRGRGKRESRESGESWDWYGGGCVLDTSLHMADTHTNHTHYI